MPVESAGPKGADYVYPEEIVDEYGECRYFVEGAPSCIIGHVLSYLGGVPDEAIEGYRADTVLPSYGPWSDEECMAARSSQSTQDHGATWGEALAAYDAHMAELS